MKKLLSTAMVLAMALSTFTGCSDLDKDGNLKEASKYTTVENEFVRYKVRNDFTDISGLDDADEGTYLYKAKNTFWVNAPTLYDDTHSSPETYIEHLNLVFHNEENKTSDIIYGDEYDVVEYGYTKEESRVTSYTIKRRGHELDGYEVMAVYPDREDEALMRQLAFELLENTEYIGEPREIVTSFDCEYFSMDLSGDTFEFAPQTDSEENEAIVKYQYYDNLCKRLSKFEVDVFTESEYSSPQEYLQSQLDKAVGENSKKENRIIEDITETEILGYDGYSVVYETGSLGELPKNSYTEYAFNKDGVIYSVMIKVSNSDGSEQVKADFEKLIECIEIK